MRKEKLSIEHRQALYGKLKDLGLSISEYSFANLFLFRDAHDYEVIFDDQLFVAGKTYAGEAFLLPVFDVRTADIDYLKKMMGSGAMLFPIAEECIGAFDEKDFLLDYHEDDMDYVFTVEKISTYPGKKLHGKRNLLEQFLTAYDHEKFAIDKERRADALAILDRWQKESGMPEQETDYRACREALERQDDLLLCGGIYYVFGEPAGFILGEAINEDMFALHFAKGLTHFKGIYQFMYNSCAGVLGLHYKFLNFEQDLGKIALRRAKSSYHPDLMLKKYRVRLR
ncbi:MAG: DUF2156 domain-containing protein [Spirochaetes bacterium]|nr:MAG: DUF2156 domain-containing protein [Spirochaetota bacterium]